MRLLFLAALLGVIGQQVSIQPNQDDFMPNSRSSKKKNRPKSGKLRDLIVTSYIEGVEGSGKVWVVPVSDPDKSYVLVGGLDRPRNVCVDAAHGFLYVCDLGSRQILQFSLEVSSSLLNSLQVNTISTNSSPSCVVSTDGSLYFSDISEDSIRKVDYDDLKLGYMNSSYVVFSGNDTEIGVKNPIAVDTDPRDEVYFMNSNETQDLGLLLKGNEGQNLTALIRSEDQPLSLSISHFFAYYSTASGSILAYRYRKRPNLYLKSASFFHYPTGICTGSKKVYIADNGLGGVYSIPDNSQEEGEFQPEIVLKMNGVMGVFCLSR